MDRSELARVERFRTARVRTGTAHGSADPLERALAAKMRFVPGQAGRAGARWQNLRTRIVDLRDRSALPTARRRPRP